jgi:uncharacterized alkaline shock family protein YloU
MSDIAYPNTLPCGVPLDEIYAQVVDQIPPARPEHQARCPHCRAALADLSEGWAPVARLAAKQIAAPSNLLKSVLAKVRQTSRDPDPWYGMITTDHGRTRVAASVVGAIARLAAQKVPHVSIAFGRRRTTRGNDPATIAGAAGESATNVGVARSQLVIDVQIVIEMGANIPTLADQVRSAVHTDIERFTGLTAAEVDVTVIDVLPRASR